MPDLLAMKILASSTVEIAAASVGETNLVKAVREIEADGKGVDSTQEVHEPEALEATAEIEAKEAPEEAAVVESEEELKSADPEEEAGAEDGQTPPVEEVIAEETPVSAEAKEEEEASSAPTVEEAEDQAPHPETASEEAVSSAEDAVPAEEATPVEEVTPSTPVDETSHEMASAEEAAAEAVTEETVEAVVDTTQLAAASTGSDLEVLSASVSEATLEAPVHEAKHCHSCHSAPSSGEEVAPPAALGEELVTEEAVDITHETKEVTSLMEGQTIENVVVVTVQT